MIKALIIEDELTSSELLTFLIGKYVPEVEVVGSAQTVEDALVFAETNTIDLVFLDINLGTDSGFDFIRESTKDVKIIVTSAHEEYALQAIQAQVLYYLLKPILIDELIFAVKLFSKSAENNALIEADQAVNIGCSSLVINSLDKIDIIKFNELMYITSTGKYSTFVLSTGRSVVSSTNIGQYFWRLPSENFLRVHNSFIVNIDFVLSIQKGDNWNCILENDVSIPISRRKRDEIMEALHPS